MSTANMGAVIGARRRNAQNAPRPLSPEHRAKIVADSMGLLGHEDRKKAVYETALAQIRAAIAIAVTQASQGYDHTESVDG